MSHVATGCLIGGFLLLARDASSLSFEHVLAGNVLSPGRARNAVFLLFLAGFGVKAGIIPLHVWLPEAHPAAPTSISALMSGVLIKTGIYGLFRVCAFGLGEPPLAWGVLVAGRRRRVRDPGRPLRADAARPQAPAGVPQHREHRDHPAGAGAGMMALSAGRGELAAVGIAASLFHVLNHALFKGLLFLGAGGVVIATGTRQIEEMGGLARRMPWTALCFLVGAAAISGLPLLNGFVSEWLLFQAFLFGFHLSRKPSCASCSRSAGALLALDERLGGGVFREGVRDDVPGPAAEEKGRRKRTSRRADAGAAGLLAGMCVVLGLAPGWVLEVLRGVAGSLPGVRPAPEMVRAWFAIAPGPGHFDHLAPPLVAGRCWWGWPWRERCRWGWAMR